MRGMISELCTRFPRRGACSDAERRAAVWLHGQLHGAGHEAFVETVWVRPQWVLTLTVHAVVGVAASLVATAAPVAGLSLAGATAISYALELLGIGGPLRPLLIRRATQVVLVEPDADRFALLIVASTDAPRRGLVLRDAWRRAAARLRRALGGRAPGPLTWVLVALLAVAAAAAARVAGLEEAWLSGLQFVPTMGLLLAAAAAIDIGLSPPSPGANDAASAVAVALALHDELARRPPERLSPGLVLAGAGELHPLGARAHLRRERPDPRRTVVLELGPCGAGAPAYRSHHAELSDICAAAAESAPAAPFRLRRPTASRAAAALRVPALHVRCLDDSGIAPREAVDDAALTAALDFCLAVVDELDAELAERAQERAEAPA